MIFFFRILNFPHIAYSLGRLTPIDLHALGKTKWAMHYYTSVSKFAGIEHPPPVLLQIYFDGLERLSEDFLNFRGDKYQIIDKEHYKVQYFDQNESIIKKQILYSF